MARKTTPTQAPKETPATVENAKSLSDVPDEIKAEWIKSRKCTNWVNYWKVKAEKGNLIDFQSHRFLYNIFEDWTPIQAVRKAAQVGFSTMVILKTLWAARYKNYNVIYTLPTSGDAAEFVKTKVNSIIGQNADLRAWTRDADSIQVKKVGDRFIYYRGTFSNKTEDEKTKSSVATMFSADLLIHDEADRSDQLIMDSYESRLANSTYKGRWLFSNPTTFDTNSEKLWGQSDQKHWFVRCEHCNEWQYLSWPDSVDIGRSCFVCQKCTGEISSLARRDGAWVRRYQNRDISGYWISHLMCPWITAADIIKASAGDPYVFNNYVLGLPYSGTGISINETLILKNLAQGTQTGRMVIGVDVGIKKHYVLGNYQGIIKVGEFEDWTDFDLLMENYDIELAIIDSRPDITKPREMVKKYPGRVWLTWFKPDIKKVEFINWDEKTKTVTVDRSKIIGEVVNDLVESKTRYYLTEYDLLEYIKHFKTIKKIREKDRMGNTIEVWTTSSDTDHYVFAHCYYKVGIMKRGMDRKVTGLKEYAQPRTLDVTQRVLDMDAYIKEQIKNEKKYGGLLGI